MALIISLLGAYEPISSAEDDINTEGMVPVTCIVGGVEVESEIPVGDVNSGFEQMDKSNLGDSPTLNNAYVLSDDAKTPIQKVGIKTTHTENGDISLEYYGFESNSDSGILLTDSDKIILEINSHYKITYDVKYDDSNETIPMQDEYVTIGDQVSFQIPKEPDYVMKSANYTDSDNISHEIPDQNKDMSRAVGIIAGSDVNSDITVHVLLTKKSSAPNFVLDDNDMQNLRTSFYTTGIASDSLHTIGYDNNLQDYVFTELGGVIYGSILSCDDANDNMIFYNPQPGYNPYGLKVVYYNHRNAYDDTDVAQSPVIIPKSNVRTRDQINSQMSKYSNFINGYNNSDVAYGYTIPQSITNVSRIDTVLTPFNYHMIFENASDDNSTYEGNSTYNIRTALVGNTQSVVMHVPQSIPGKAGYSFDGWKLKELGDIYHPGDDVLIPSDLLDKASLYDGDVTSNERAFTFEAIWTPISDTSIGHYTIDYYSELPRGSQDDNYISVGGKQYSNFYHENGTGPLGKSVILTDDNLKEPINNFKYTLNNSITKRAIFSLSPTENEIKVFYDLKDVPKTGIAHTENNRMTLLIPIAGLSVVYITKRILRKRNGRY